MALLNHQRILLGITGGIAAYKSAELVRRLKEAGALVRVVMTQAAKSFITPLTLQALSEEPVYEALLDEKAEEAMGHIALARWADWVLVAPASADFIARFAHGHANDLLSTLCLATQAPIMVVPAMNRVMWENVATQANVEILSQRGVCVLGPAAGLQACGEIGLGRMVEPQEIIQALISQNKIDILAGKHVLITAGPTREPIDPVRYITNKSSGKMGYALAQAALAAGAKVTLVSGPVHMVCPSDIQCFKVETAREMLAVVMNELKGVDIFIGAAAVADYHSLQRSVQKMKKSTDTVDLRLVKNVDILAAVAALPNPPFTVGFAAETRDILGGAHAKLVSKKVDMMFANAVGKAGCGFESDDNEVVAVWKDGKQHFPLMSKKRLAKQLIELVAQAMPYR